MQPHLKQRYTLSNWHPSPLRLFARYPPLPGESFNRCFTSPTRVAFTAPVSDFRPSATPLFVLSPTTAVWLRSDNITDMPATHWIPFFSMSMTGYVRIDGKPFRFLGVDFTPAADADPVLAPSMQQTSRVVQNTQTHLHARGRRYPTAADFHDACISGRLGHLVTSNRLYYHRGEVVLMAASMLFSCTLTKLPISR